MKKIILTLVVTFMALAVSAQGIVFDGAVSSNVRYRFNNASASKTGDFVFDCVKLGVGYETPKYRVYAKIRTYKESFGGLMIPEAYIQYKGGKYGNFTIGGQRLPMNYNKYFSNSYYLDMNYYMGFSDKYMMGLTWRKDVSKSFTVALGYYMNPITSVSWTNDKLEKGRYSNDINSVKYWTEVDASARETSTGLVAFGLHGDNWNVWSATRVGALKANHTTVSLVSQLSGEYTHKNWQFGASLTYYNYDRFHKTSRIAFVHTTAFGDDSFGIDARPKGFVESVKVQYTTGNFRIYAEESSLLNKKLTLADNIAYHHHFFPHYDPRGVIKKEVSVSPVNMAVVGVNYTNESGLSASLEYVHGHNHPWVQNTPDGNLINLNLTYNFKL